MNKKLINTLGLSGLFLLLMSGVALAGDPGGGSTGGQAAFDALYAGKTATEAIGHNAVSINFVWTLVTAFLVMFMQAGFALVETGFCQKKNAVHVIMTNFMIYAIGITGFFICGFAFMFGGAGGIATLGGVDPLNGIFEVAKGWGIIGTKGFFLNSGGTYDVGVYALFLFQMVFMDTAATIPTGAMAERWKFSAFCIFGLFISMVIYPIFGNWVWGGGWLAKLGVNLGLGHGYIDFAGSSVVHAVGGITALAGCIVIGPRLGKFNKDGSANVIPPHDIPMAILGTFILAFGWFGFNPGSTLAGTDLRIAVVAVNTMLASAAGAITAMLIMWKKFGKPDPSMSANGMLAGMVAITAPCAFVNSWAAVVIGIIAGALVVGSVFFVERVLKLDDPVGAISVHGANGLWGVISLGLFADGTYGDGWGGVAGSTVKGLFYGDSSQFLAQCIGAVTCFVFVFVLAYLFFKTQDKIMGIRSKPEDELRGLDIPEMGIGAYHDDPEPMMS
jgi:ammonium transporter, Amt family